MFVVVEGPNGSGKTSLINSLSKEGYETLSSPNGTPLAKILRPACRGTDPWIDIDKRVQFLLFSAARMDEYVRCVHNKDVVVVADRWWTSTYIYQCLLQGLSVDFLEHTIHPEEKIDLVILLDGDDDILINRVLSERDSNPDHGKCKWTQDAETMKKLIGLYRNELAKYLRSKNITVLSIDTTSMSCQDVLEEVKKEINRYVNI